MSTIEIKLQSGQLLTLRPPTSADAKILQTYINQLSAERTFIRYQGEEITLKQEQEYVDGLVEKIAKQQVYHLLGFVDGQLVAAAGIELGDKTEAHQGLLGVSVAKDFRGLGIGRALMETLLAQAPGQLPVLRIITLQHMSHNLKAQNLYQKLGFIEYGRLPKGIKHRGQYVDEVLMYKNVERNDS